MSIVKNEITEVEARRLVQRAAVLMRMRPVPGSDHEQAKEWLDRVLAFLHSTAMLQLLHQIGVTPPADFCAPVQDQAAVLDHVADSLDSHEDFAPPLAVAVVVELAYLGLLGYALYTHYTQEHAPADGASE